MSKISVQEKRFYVYAYLRAKDSEHGKRGSPYYIGKGTKKRRFQKHGWQQVPKDSANNVILSQGMTETDAHQAEMLLIAFYGRIAIGTGMLQNQTDGGDGSSGHVPSTETRKKVSQAITGLKRSAATRAKMSHSKRGYSHTLEARAAMSKSRIGQKHKPESIEKARLANLGQKRSEETKRRIGNGNRGKTRSVEDKARTSQFHKGRPKPRTAEHQAKLVASRKERALKRLEMVGQDG